MKIIKPFCIILFLLINTGVFAQAVDVTVSYAAKYRLRPDTNTIVLVNKFDISSLKVSNKKALAVMKEAAYAAIRHGGFQLGELPHTRIINVVDSVGLTVNTDSIKQTAAKYHANYVLALTNFSAKITVGEISDYGTSYNSSLVTNFMLYEDNGVFFRKLNGTAEDPIEQQLNAGLIMSLIFQPTIKGNKMAIRVSAEHASENAMQDFFPYTLTHTRPLFNDKFLRPINQEIMNGNFEKADSLLQPYLKDIDAKVASRAAYTLAIVYESENNLEDATDMANESNTKNKNGYAEAMLADLKEE
ncbi:hypothetical protein KXD93_29130 [Mucilaginibacter sp. BJC16-A38]|uniref:DUF6340 family protein n=1 Tax=Mucilaginibacter phenanthrenivorans TaxID=1234842 RepID=UPI0021579EC1|nr:DUF6340 family protein [Mucilaginibacter phenanthrenivorans]MCR8561755.1 hypothetical protein [Mucilaginibacter phenanthrenivorans]